MARNFPYYRLPLRGLSLAALVKHFFDQELDKTLQRADWGIRPLAHAHKRIVICGGGAIGAAIAYFISLRGVCPIVIERHEGHSAWYGQDQTDLAQAHRLLSRVGEMQP